MSMFPMPRIGVADERFNAKPVLRDCLEAVLQQSDRLMDAVIEGLNSSKPQQLGSSKGFATAQSRGGATIAGSNPAQQRAVEYLRTHAAEVKITFATELRAALYYRGAHDMAVKPLLRFDDFQFLDEKEIDSNIEFALAQQEVSQAVEDTLPPLNALMSNLLGLISVQSQLNPLKPESFVQALRSSLGAHVDDHDVRVVLLTRAASLMGISLRQLYKDVTNWLRSQGVEPAMPLGVAPGGAGATGAKPIETAVSRTLLTLDKLRRLLAGDFDPRASAPAQRDFLHTVPFSVVALEDLKLVEPMMLRLAKRAKQRESTEAQREGASFGNSGMLAKDQPKNKQIGQELGGEVVRLMLENLMNDRRLLPRIRELLKDLEPVLLELSRSDPRYFSERQHPARQLLDRMTHRSLAYSSESDEGFGRFSKALSNGVQVLTGGEGDAAAFARVLRKLEEGWERDEDAQRKRHEENARALLHAEQRNMLAQRVAEDFQKQLADKDVPDMIGAFLRGPWAQVIAQAQLSRADGVPDPDGYAALVEDLIWSVQLKLTRRNRSKLVQMVPNLLVKLRQGLQLIHYPEERIPVLFDALVSVHEQAFELPDGSRADAHTAQDGDPTTVPPEMAASFDGPDVDDPWLAESESNESGFLGAVDHDGLDLPTDTVAPHGAEPGRWSVADLAIGSWVELRLEGEWVRAQLTWSSPHQTLFMFVSGRGLAHSMSRRTMDRRRAQGLIRVVSDGNVVGSALDGVAQTALRNNPERDAA
jgi:Protein of unknown function (DUF1631)